MIASNQSSTRHEELSQKVHRIPGETWGEYATLPASMTVQPSTSDIQPRKQLHADKELLDSTGFSTSEGTEFYKAFLGAVESSNVRTPEVLRESILSLRKATEEWKVLITITSSVFRESHQAFTEVSEIGSLPDKWLIQFKRPAESDWNDVKNDRRCELIDKEIEGTLEPAEIRELEELQNQMLAYRRKVAPLPLKEAQKLHQQLLKKAADQED